MREAAGGGGGARDTESKTRTPHKDVGKKMFSTTTSPIFESKKMPPAFGI